LSKKKVNDLSRRERQIMDIVFERGQATVAEVLEGLTDPPSYSAVRALMRVLVEKSMLTHAKEGRRYVYKPAVSRHRAKQSALKRVMKTFFDNSPESVVAALISNSEADLTDEELERIEVMIARARREGK